MVIALVMALAAAAEPPTPTVQPARRQRTAWIFSTIGHSEFCPAGNVHLDLTSGRYLLTARAARSVCNRHGLERPVLSGRLEAKRLATIRTAYRHVLAQGLHNRDCRDARFPGAIVVSNGGTPTVIIATGAFTASAPDNLTCWTGAARALQQALDDAFRSAQRH